MGIEILTLERKSNYRCTSSVGECLGERAFGRSLTDDLRVSIKLLQVTGLYTFCCHDNSEVQQNPVLKKKKIATEAGLLLTATGFMILNVILMFYNVYAMHHYTSHFGLWDAETVMIVISGMKPIQSLINIGTMTYRRHRHRQLFRQMSELDRLFRAEFSTSVNGRWINGAMLGGAVIVILSCCLLRLVQYVIRGEIFGANWYADISFLIIVFLGLWQFIPIWYFHLLNILVRFWLDKLGDAISRQRKLSSVPLNAFNVKPKHTIQFLVDTYFKIAGLIKTLDRVFNVFILLSVARCIFALCLTICFLTEADKVLNLPDNLKLNVRMNVYFNVAWSSLEILLAFMYIFIISYGGMKTNEQARLIIGSVLNCDASTDEERFLVYVLTQKVNTQSSWGISAWRAFPIERTFGFTIGSGILTFFFLIRKLKDTSAQNCDEEVFADALNITGLINQDL